MENKLEAFFKPEVRSHGTREFQKGLVALSSMNDTGIMAYVKAGSGAKVQFQSEGVASQSFVAKCSCPVFKKGRFCKHIWATVLAVEEKYSDFLESKVTIEKLEIEEPLKADRPQRYTQRQTQRQNQKQKVRPPSRHQIQLPDEVQEALRYFSSNGFELESELNEDSLRIAKKKLSLIFHPDRGGSHGEILTLNENYEILNRFIQS
jgi:uncharacterized Zn finger protein